MTTLFKPFTWLALLILFFSCVSASVPANPDKVSHVIWDSLVKKHVNESGLVDYSGLIRDSVRLNSYLAILENNPPNPSTWSADEQLAFWINAYNAFTVRLIIRNYPCKSIKDLGGKIYKINTPWDIKFIRIGGEIYDLNNIEHSCIRRKFDDPRIHFALNCASISCPILANEAFIPEKLQKQLTLRAELFLRDSSRNIVKTEVSQLSKLFSWYKSDFEIGENKLIDFINRYSEIKLTNSTEIEFLDYDWSLNSQ